MLLESSEQDLHALDQFVVAYDQAGMNSSTGKTGICLSKHPSQRAIKLSSKTLQQGSSRPVKDGYP